MATTKVGATLCGRPKSPRCEAGGITVDCLPPRSFGVAG